MNKEIYTEADAERELEMEEPEEMVKAPAMIAEDEMAEAVESPKVNSQQALSFEASEGLAWPIVGDVILNYSMDEAVYF